MPHPQLDNLVRSGDLKAESAEPSEFAGLVSSGSKRLRDANNDALELESRFDLAYNAAHALSLAGLRWHGYRPAKNNRYIVFPALAHTLGLQPAEWRVLSEAHRRRNTMEYEGFGQVDKATLDATLRVAALVLDGVQRLGPIGGGS
jgi:hypothetical protein